MTNGLEPLGTHQKVLNLNLDPAIFGSFAEIGAGQEVARWFLTAGAASGTVAKTISAYDKEVSDDLYGAGTRYVSRQRLEAMLEREWTQLQGQLRESRGARSRFFAFADTVSARNYAGTNECHGWMGIQFAQNVRIYAYPMSRADLEPRLQALPAGNWELEATGPWVTADQFRPAAPLGHLYAYLIETGFIAPMRAVPPAAPTPSG